MTGIRTTMTGNHTAIATQTALRYRDKAKRMADGADRFARKIVVFLMPCHFALAAAELYRSAAHQTCAAWEAAA
jgi:hypothetical protein